MLERSPRSLLFAAFPNLSRKAIHRAESRAIRVIDRVTAASRGQPPVRHPTIGPIHRTTPVDFPDDLPYGPEHTTNWLRAQPSRLNGRRRHTLQGAIEIAWRALCRETACNSTFLRKTRPGPAPQFQPDMLSPAPLRAECVCMGPPVYRRPVSREARVQTLGRALPSSPPRPATRTSLPHHSSGRPVQLHVDNDKLIYPSPWSEASFG